MNEKNSNKVLNVRKLTTVFHNGNEVTTAVHQVYFDLYKGEMLGIVGESGSGKSVTAYSILQLLNSKKSEITGSVLFQAQDEFTEMLALREEEMRGYRGKKIALIFQEPMSSLNPTMKCGKQVDEMLELHTSLNASQRKAKILELFSKVKLPEPERIYNSYPHLLSGGQIQRVVIAMAVSSNPEIIIADEPTTALDVTVQKEILDLLIALRKEIDTSIIFISHDLQLVRKFCDRIIVMHRGKIVEKGTTKEIFESPQQAYTKGLIACRPQGNFDKARLPTVEDYITQVDPQQQKTYDPNFGEVVLEVKGVKKYYVSKKNWYGRAIEFTKAVDDVSFYIKEREILGIVGESGCGKSTLGKLIGRIIEPDQGDILFNGDNIFSYKNEKLKAYRRACQLIFQDPYGSLNPRMKIGDAILEPILCHKLMSKSKGKDYVNELLLKTGLSESHYQRYPHEFSGGQRQRIAIARALAVKPKLLLCDECISALDVSVQAQIINLLLDLRESEGLSIFFIAHDLAAVRFISDRILVMNNGKVVESGDAVAIYENPTHPYTQKLIESIL